MECRDCKDCNLDTWSVLTPLKGVRMGVEVVDCDEHCMWVAPDHSRADCFKPRNQSGMTLKEWLKKKDAILEISDICYTYGIRRCHICQKEKCLERDAWELITTHRIYEVAKDHLGGCECDSCGYLAAFEAERGEK